MQWEAVTVFMVGWLIGIVFMALFPLDVCLAIWSVSAVFLWVVSKLPQKR